MAPPGGAPAPGAGPANTELQKSLETWFVLSLISIVCGCGCLAVVPIYLTYAGKKSLSEGNVADAESKLKIAKICIIAGIAYAVVATVLTVLYLVVFGGLAAVSNLVSV